MGSGVMRAAANLTGVMVENGNLPVPLSAAGSSSSVRPASALVSPAEDVKLVASRKAACVEANKLGFAGDDGELVMIGGEPMPRVLFTGVPSIQEAKEATSELNVALEAYLSPPHSNTGMEETSVLSETGMAHAAPLHAVQALRLLSERSAQNVVTSIMSDPNVWNAVVQNQTLREYMNSWKTMFCGCCGWLVVRDSDMEDSVQDSEADPSEEEPEPGFFEKIKAWVADMMHRLSDFFWSFFGGQKGAENEDGTANITDENVMEGSFMGLSVMAILVTVLKRLYVHLQLSNRAFRL